jgi:uncharacterized protein YdaU (DUF1376 family)
MDWYPWFPHEFRRDTYHLSPAEDGAYRRLIDEYMVTRLPLPNDDAALARIVGIPKAEWEDLAPRVRPFFRARNDRLYHKRCEQELRAQDARHNRNSERAKKAAFARYSKNNGLTANRMLAPATLHNKDRTSSLEQDAARATNAAPCGTSPAVPAESQQGRRWENGAKPVSQASRAEIEAGFPKRKPQHA